MSSIPIQGDIFAEDYRIERRLAAGGMGTVFAVVEIATGKPFAIKLLHPELAKDQKMRRRFRREAAVLKALDHPAVVRVWDLGMEPGGAPFFVMERLNGETLRSRITRGGLPAAELLPILRGIAEGLSAAHDHGVLHGDLKPENVFLLTAPNVPSPVKLVDFGTSKILGLERLTKTGELAGTPVYMAPELITGRGGLNETIDTYAMGALAYEAISGKPPFSQRSDQLLVSIAAGQSRPIREVAAHVSADVEEVLAMAIHADSRRRFTHPLALYRALAQAF